MRSFMSELTSKTDEIWRNLSDYQHYAKQLLQIFVLELNLQFVKSIHGDSRCDGNHNLAIGSSYNVRCNGECPSIPAAINLQ